MLELYIKFILREVFTMPDMIKFMCFSLVGVIVFLILSIFFPILILVPTGFMSIAALSLIIYWFQLIKTKHHFLKLAISFFTILTFFGLMYLIVEVFGINHNSDIMFVTMNTYILKYGFVFGLALAACCLLIFASNILLHTFIGLTYEKNIIIFMFRIGCFWALSIFEFPKLQRIAQLLLILAYVYNIISVTLLISNHTNTSTKIKLIYINVICIILSIILQSFIQYGNVWILGYILNVSITINLICKIICNVFMLLFLLQLFINMIIKIFSIPKVSVSKKLLLYYFIPVLFSSAGLLISGGLFYYYQNIPFSILPSETVYYQDENIIQYISVDTVYYIAMIVFSISIAISFMSVAYRLIFNNKSSKEVNPIDIDNI